MGCREELKNVREGTHVSYALNGKASTAAVVMRVSTKRKLVQISYPWQYKEVKVFIGVFELFVQKRT